MGTCKTDKMAETANMDVSPIKKEKKKKRKSESMDVGDIQEGTEFKIEPVKEMQQKLMTADWPLLLENFEKLNIRTAHYTPIPAGSSPLQRPIADYVSQPLLARGCGLDQ